MQLKGSTSSHVGKVRDNNEDSAVFTGWVAAVADGVGGAKGGEVASSLAVEQLGMMKGQVTPATLVEMVTQANQAVFGKSDAPELRGMGTTVVAIALHGDQTVTAANVGDSRCYFLRDGDLTQVTNDHSLVEDLVRQGHLTAEEAQTHPQRNIVTRVLGMEPTIEVDRFTIAAQIGDRFLLCSDGLTNEVDEDNIRAILDRIIDVDECAKALIKSALDGGGRDNVTVAVIDVIEDAEGLNVAKPRFAAKKNLWDEDDPVVDERVADPRANWVESTSIAGTVRTVLLAFGVIAVLAAGYFGTSWYAQSAWFVESEQGQVAIFRGRPGGTLWLDPSVEDVTDIAVDDLNQVGRERLRRIPEFDSLLEAEEFVDGLLAESAADTTEIETEPSTEPATQSSAVPSNDGSSTPVDG